MNQRKMSEQQTAAFPAMALAVTGASPCATQLPFDTGQSSGKSGFHGPHSERGRSRDVPGGEDSEMTVECADRFDHVSTESHCKGLKREACLEQNGRNWRRFRKTCLASIDVEYVVGRISTGRSGHGCPQVSPSKRSAGRVAGAVSARHSTQLPVRSGIRGSMEASSACLVAVSGEMDGSGSAPTGCRVEPESLQPKEIINEH